MSFTVTVNVQLDVLADASVTEHVTVVAPFGNVDPDGGTQPTAPTPGQLSVAVGALYDTTAVQTPAPAGVVMFAGHAVNVGACKSLTVTVKLQGAAALPEVSDPVQFTVVIPFANVAPEAGTQVNVAPGQLSLMVVVKLTTAVHTFAAVLVVMFAGQVSVGA